MPLKKRPAAVKPNPSTKKEQRVDQHLASGVADGTVLVHYPGAPSQIAYIQRHQGEHTGREKAEQTLDKDGEYRHAGLQLQIHRDSPFCVDFSWRSRSISRT